MENSTILYITITGHPNYEINQYGQVRNKKTGKYLSGVHGKKIVFTENGKRTQWEIKSLIMNHFFPRIEGEWVTPYYINGEENTAENIGIHNVYNAYEDWKNKKLNNE